MLQYRYIPIPAKQMGKRMLLNIYLLFSLLSLPVSYRSFKPFGSIIQFFPISPNCDHREGPLEPGHVLTTWLCTMSSTVNLFPFSFLSSFVHLVTASAKS